MTKKHKQFISDLALMGVAAFWGGGFVAVKDGLSYITPMFLAAIRFVLAAIFLYLFLHRKIGKIRWGDLKKGAVVGTILFAAFAAQTVGLQYTTASKQGFLTAVYVILVPFLTWVIFRKKPPVKALLGSIMTIVGIGLISLQGSLTINRGDLLTLLCALLFAFHIMALDYYTKKMDIYKLSFLQIAVAAVWFVLGAFITEPIPSSISMSAWGSILYLAFFSTFLCFTIQTFAQKYTSSSHAAILLSLESVFAAILGVIILKEHMSPSMIMGAVLIFIAILMVEVEWPQKENMKLLRAKSSSRK